jgi:hypothetical protein
MKIFITKLFLNAAVIHTALNTITHVNAKRESYSRIRQRNLKKAKAPKQPKPPKGGSSVTIVDNFCPVSTVTAAVTNVQGNTAVVPGTDVEPLFTQALSDCTASTGGLGVNFAECMSSSPGNGVYFYYPLFARNGDGTSATSQFVSAATDASGAGGASPGSLNDSYFKGDTACTDPSCAANKVDIQWFDYSLSDVFNVPIADIEYIQYDFFPLICPNDSTCYKQFYLGVYTHRATGGGLWYDCRLNFIPSEGAVGQWNTFTINSDTISSTYQVKGACPDGSGGLITTVGGQVTGVAAFEDGTGAGYEFLLGAAGEPTNPDNPLIFAFNMGDTSFAADDGLVGYFDNIRVKIKNRPLIIYDL